MTESVGRCFAHVSHNFSSSFTNYLKKINVLRDGGEVSKIYKAAMQRYGSDMAR